MFWSKRKKLQSKKKPRSPAADLAAKTIETKVRERQSVLQVESNILMNYEAATQLNQSKESESDQ